MRPSSPLTSLPTWKLSMKPSSLSTCAMVTFTLVDGISTAGDSIRFALRMRVNMSAIESVIIIADTPAFNATFARAAQTLNGKRWLPACLFYARDQPLVGHVAEANAADAELAINGTGTAAQTAAKTHANE